MTEYDDSIDGELVPGFVDPLAAAIRDAIGATETESVRIYAPPHRARLDGKEVRHFPLTLAEFEGLRNLRKEKLVEIGLRPWDKSGLLLFPYEWYPLIPAGFVVTDIFGNEERFEPGTTDDDCRFGVLAFGIIPRGDDARD